MSQVVLVSVYKLFHKISLSPCLYLSQGFTCPYACICPQDVLVSKMYLSPRCTSPHVSTCSQAVLVPTSLFVPGCTCPHLCTCPCVSVPVELQSPMAAILSRAAVGLCKQLGQYSALKGCAVHSVQCTTVQLRALPCSHVQCG